MNNADSQQIVLRFAEAIKRLKTDRKLRGIQTFTRAYNINRRNFITAINTPESNIFQIAWLAYLVRDFDVSPDWLLTGEGSFYAGK